MKKNSNKIIVPVVDMKAMGQTLRTLGLEVTHSHYVGTEFYTWIIKGGNKYSDLLGELRKVSDKVLIS